MFRGVGGELIQVRAIKTCDANLLHITDKEVGVEPELQLFGVCAGVGGGECERRRLPVHSGFNAKLQALIFHMGAGWGCFSPSARCVPSRAFARPSG